MRLSEAQHLTLEGACLHLMLHSKPAFQSAPVFKSVSQFAHSPSIQSVGNTKVLKTGQQKFCSKYKNDQRGFHRED